MTSCEFRLTVMLALKVMISPATALLRAERSEPTPLSALLVTVMVDRAYWYAAMASAESTLWLSMTPVEISRVQSPPRPVRLSEAAISRPVYCARESTKPMPVAPSAVLQA